MLVILLSWSCKFMVQWTKIMNFLLLMGQDQKILKFFPFENIFLLLTNSWDPNYVQQVTNQSSSKKCFIYYERWGEININLKFHHLHFSYWHKSSWTTWTSPQTLTNGTSFWINLKIILNVFFTFFILYEFFFTRCVELLFYFNVEDCKNIWYILKLFV